MFIVLSIALGLLSWSFPILNIFLKKDNLGVIRFVFFPIFSFSLTIMAIILHLHFGAKLINIPDIGSYLDTIDGSIFGANVLLIITSLLNTIAMYTVYIKTKK
ncbi:MAG: hypothetical protein PT934_01995 [Peptoniphilaceae bacterium]|uniref:hypothetical protein n=1 Tax=Parvimonas sp. TaxID=1944660 RepID=UPI0025D09E08|nr:hypothetical protein [Parvimonas sp.]MCI5996735.1 hypothetical protein [Parvimonas sp.]MDD7764520.1 hypothetical protein [Peptoniphilaceae bacterium]MDY3050462.1 hypothetical protein [Parvimonas sp.]